jgi:hypothetical protein
MSYDRKKGEIRMDKTMNFIYRTAIFGMYGYYEDEYFDTLEKAEKRFAEIIEEKKKDKNTLNDKDCNLEGQQEKNFTETNINTMMEENNASIKVLKSIAWSYGFDQCSEEGTEFYSYTDEIVLHQIILK